MLEMTGTVEKRKMKEQLLDQMDLERERGITIKMQPVRMNYKEYIFNLIDTPGHVDFGYEVSRSLAAVEGAVLLVDATKGVQAQTLANLYQAIDHNLEIIPVVNKIDLPNANVEKAKKEIVHILGCKEEEILEVSGKTGQGVANLLEIIAQKIPAPIGDSQKTLRALIFDSKYDTYKGVLAHVRVFDGEIRAEEEIIMMINDKKSDVIEVGYFKPELVKAEKLSVGEIGYIATGLKSVGECKVGDTITMLKVKGQISNVEPLPGYKEVVPMVYASFYPVEGDDYNLMRDSLDKLKLNDASFVFEPESNLALGRGFRCGFLGLLHLEIIQSRLQREFQINPTVTTPSVVYEITLRNGKGRIKVYSPTEFPDPSEIEEVFEPYVSLEIVSPSNYLGPIMEVMNNTRAQYQDTEYLDSERMVIKFDCPLTDVVTNLHDDLKSASSGYASMNYEVKDYRSYDLVKMDILVAKKKSKLFHVLCREKRLIQKEKE
jgi:GTP-binding protein LepA